MRGIGGADGPAPASGSQQLPEPHGIRGRIDLQLEARRVAPSGIAYGLDMTDEMLELARANQPTAGVVIADPDMDDATRADMQQYVGCVAGALTHDEYARYLADAGLTEMSQPTRMKDLLDSAEDVERGRGPAAADRHRRN